MTMRVLYVDDDRINALLFVETCRLAGDVQVETADTGAEALALVTPSGEFRPDVLVIDLHLPDTDGYALLPALRLQLGEPEMPAYLCTADEVPAVADPARRAGFTGCWTKPVVLPAMLDELSRLQQALGAVKAVPAPQAAVRSPEAAAAGAPHAVGGGGPVIGAS